jgi:phosphoglycolate phosphatase-like HAD superfamily hydrolase
VESDIFRTGAGRGVVALDIDGTLGDYHGHFLNFAAGWLGRPMPPADAINPGRRLSEFMGIDHAVYRRIKLAYRQGGMKRTMPVYPGASGLTVWLKDQDIEIWICTTRPYNRLDNIDEDTQEWLNRNQIKFDAILWDNSEGNGKYIELVRQVGIGRIIAVIDDLPAQLHEAKSVGIENTYLRAQPYNLRGSDRDGMIRVHSLSAFREFLRFHIAAWQEKTG